MKKKPSYYLFVCLSLAITCHTPSTEASVLRYCTKAVFTMLCLSSSSQADSHSIISQGTFTSVVTEIDSFETPVILARNNDSDTLSLFRCDQLCNSISSVTAITSGSGVGYHADMVLDRSPEKIDIPSIVFENRTASQLVFIHCKDESCLQKESEFPLAANIQGREPSLKLSPSDGFASVAFYNSVNRHLTFAKCGNDLCPENMQQISPVDTFNSNGRYPSHVFNAAGGPLIVYHSTSEKSLKMAECGISSCGNSNIQKNYIATQVGATVGLHPLIELRTNKKPTVFYYYYNSTHGVLSLLYCYENLCDNREVTALYSGGTMNDLFVYDAKLHNDLPIIAYITSDNRLTLLTCERENCTGSQTILDLGAIGSVTGGGVHALSLQKDSYGNALLSYYNQTSDSLEFRLVTLYITNSPSVDPSGSPSKNPSFPPSRTPTNDPSTSPSKNPSRAPSRTPTSDPSGSPSKSPSRSPSRTPTSDPSASPSNNPSHSPTAFPSSVPSKPPSVSPLLPPKLTSRVPSAFPSKNPSHSPSTLPSKKPSESPSSQPTMSPTITSSPTTSPSRFPSNPPSNTPSTNPSRQPTTMPTLPPIPSKEVLEPEIQQGGFKEEKTSDTQYILILGVCAIGSFTIICIFCSVLIYCWMKQNKKKEDAMNNGIRERKKMEKGEDEQEEIEFQEIKQPLEEEPLKAVEPLQLPVPVVSKVLVAPNLSKKGLSFDSEITHDDDEKKQEVSYIEGSRKQEVQLPIVENMCEEDDDEVCGSTDTDLEEGVETAQSIVNAGALPNLILTKGNVKDVKTSFDKGYNEIDDEEIDNIDNNVEESLESTPKEPKKKKKSIKKQKHKHRRGAQSSKKSQSSKKINKKVTFKMAKNVPKDTFTSDNIIYIQPTDNTIYEDSDFEYEYEYEYEYEQEEIEDSSSSLGNDEISTAGNDKLESGGIDNVITHGFIE
ncbi:MAG: hypothetical protein AAF335_00300 [Bacteroidota bacterium]